MDEEKEEKEEISHLLLGQTVRAVNVADLEEGFEKEVLHATKLEDIEYSVFYRWMQPWLVMH